MGNKQQVQINRMLEALEMIADMPVWQEGISLESLNAQYEEARETARLAVAQFNRSEAEAGQAFDAKALIEAAHCAEGGGRGCLPTGAATPATWRDPHGDPPEDDSDVLVRQLDPEEPAVIGRYTSDGWWMCEGVTGLRPLLREGVRGWLHLHEAVAIIDAAKPRAEFGSILAGLVARGTITQEEADRAEGRLDDRS